MVGETDDKQALIMAGDVKCCMSGVSKSAKKGRTEGGALTFL